MSLANQLRVTLGKPIPELNAHKSLHVHQGQIASIEVVGGIQISVTPVKMGPRVAVYIKRLLQTTLVVRTHLNATVYELMQMISIYTGTPVEQLGILFNNLRLNQSELGFKVRNLHIRNKN
jgi:hypothetical protein